MTRLTGLPHARPGLPGPMCLTVTQHLKAPEAVATAR
jgi:hypothetical protein